MFFSGGMPLLLFFCSGLFFLRIAFREDHFLRFFFPFRRDVPIFLFLTGGFPTEVFSLGSICLCVWYFSIGRGLVVFFFVFGGSCEGFLREGVRYRVLFVRGGS